MDPLLVLVVSLVDFFFSWSSISPKGPKKSKTCKNKKIFFTVLKPNERELFRTCPSPHKTIKLMGS
jgi:hypothetical protein